jgi:hypothetical protein
MDLIQEAKNRGYRKGTPIRYVPHAIDFVEGNYFEIHNGMVRAYRKPKNEREDFDDMKYDTLFDGIEWVQIVDLSKRTEEQKKIDDQHNIY